MSAGPTGQAERTEPPTPIPAMTAPAGLLDALGGQPMSPAAQSAWLAAAQQAWADPTRLHHAGRRAGLVLDAARQSLAQSLGSTCPEGIDPQEVWFASSPGRAMAAAVAGSPSAGPPRVRASAVETAAVLDVLDDQDSARLIPVDALGRVDVDAAAAAIDAGATGICLQVANPEVGTRQPIERVGDLCAAAGIPLFSDGSGSAGRTRLPSGWTHLVVDARDWAGPPGVAALIVRRDQRWTPPPGSARGWLAGPANVPGAAAAAMALEAVVAGLAGEEALARALIARIREQVATLPDVEVVGDPRERLPQVVTFSVLYAAGEALVHELDRRGFAVASGSACVSEDLRPSHVLAAMGAYTGGNLRISLPLGIHPGTVDAFLAVLPEAIAAARAEAGA